MKCYLNNECFAINYLDRVRFFIRSCPTIYYGRSHSDRGGVNRSSIVTRNQSISQPSTS